MATARQGKGLLTLLIFGGMFGGLSVHGMAFLDPYGRLLETVFSAPTEQHYDEALDAIANERLPEHYRQALVSFMLQNPSAEMESALKASIRRAPAGAGKQSLLSIQKSIDSQKETAKLVESAVTASRAATTSIGRLDRPTRLRVIDSLERKPESQLRALGLSREQLRSMRVR